MASKLGEENALGLLPELTSISLTLGLFKLNTCLFSVGTKYMFIFLVE